MRKIAPCQAEGCGHGARHHVLTTEGPLCAVCLRHVWAMVSRGLKVRQEVETRASHRYVSPIVAGGLTADPPPYSEVPTQPPSPADPS
jgi:hypothetical protein